MCAIDVIEEEGKHKCNDLIFILLIYID